MTDTCGYTVIDLDGIEQPCDRPAPEWRWYQDTGHENCLEPACLWHANEGGRRMHAALALADEWTEWSRGRSTPRIDAFRDAADQLRAVIKGEA